MKKSKNRIKLINVFQKMKRIFMKHKYSLAIQINQFVLFSVSSLIFVCCLLVSIKFYINYTNHSFKMHKHRNKKNNFETLFKHDTMFEYAEREIHKYTSVDV